MSRGCRPDGPTRHAPCNKSRPWARYQCTRLLITGPVTDGAVRARSEPVRFAAADDDAPNKEQALNNCVWRAVYNMKMCVYEPVCMCV